MSALPHDVQGYLAVVALGLAGTGFLFALRTAWRGRLSLRTVLGLGFVFHAVVVLLPLLTSEDVYQYAIYGRIAGVHHANPYLSPPRLFPGDAFFPLTNPGWRSLPAPYGPAFVLLARLVTSLTTHPQTAVLIFKALSALASVATMLLLAGFARRHWPTRAAFATALIALNPAVLFVVVGSGHNDALVALLLAIAFGLRVRASLERRTRLDFAATVILTLATMIKPPLVLLLLAFVTLRVIERPAAQRLRFACSHGGVAVAIALPLALPFLGTKNPFGGVAENYAHGYFLSPSSFIQVALSYLHLMSVHLIAVILAWSIRGAFLFVLVGGIGMVLRLAWQNPSWEAEGAAYGWILLLSILTSPQVRPWYFVWILPFAWLLPTLPRLAALACSAVLPLFTSVAPEFFPDLYGALVYTGIALIAPALLIVLWLLVKDLIMRTKENVPLWHDFGAAEIDARDRANVAVG